LLIHDGEIGLDSPTVCGTLAFIWKSAQRGNPIWGHALYLLLVYRTGFASQLRSFLPFNQPSTNASPTLRDGPLPFLKRPRPGLPSEPEQWTTATAWFASGNRRQLVKGSRQASVSHLNAHCMKIASSARPDLRLQQVEYSWSLGAPSRGQSCEVFFSKPSTCRSPVIAIAFLTSPSIALRLLQAAVPATAAKRQEQQQNWMLATLVAALLARTYLKSAAVAITVDPVEQPLSTLGTIAQAQLNTLVAATQ